MHMLFCYSFAAKSVVLLLSLDKKKRVTTAIAVKRIFFHNKLAFA
jgi:hypothetical protein